MVVVIKRDIKGGGGRAGGLGQVDRAGDDIQ